MFTLKKGRGGGIYFLNETSACAPCPEAERLVATANVTPKTTNSNSLLPNTASNDMEIVQILVMLIVAI